MAEEQPPNGCPEEPWSSVALLPSRKNQRETGGRPAAPGGPPVSRRRHVCHRLKVGPARAAEVRQPLQEGGGRNLELFGF